VSDPLTIGISSTALVGLIFGAGTYVADMRNTKERLAEEKKAREALEAKLEDKIQTTQGDRDRRIEKLESRIDKLEDDLSDKMDFAVAKIEGIVSGFAAKIGEVVGDMREVKAKVSSMRMEAQRPGSGPLRPSLPRGDE
jgi:chromosome segregation ATPase